MNKDNGEYGRFNRAMGAILKADPKTVKDAMDADKQANAEKRKAKKSSASGRVSRAKD